MTSSASTRRAAVAGITGAVLFVVVLLLGNNVDSSKANAAQQVVRYWSNHANRVRAEAGIALLPLAGFCYLWFVMHLAARLRSSVPGDRRLSDAVVAGGGVMVVTILAGLIVHLGFGVTAEFSKKAFPLNTANAQTSLIFENLTYVVISVAGAGAAVMLVAAGALLRKSGDLPHWLGSVAYVVAALSLVGSLLFLAPFVLTMLWTVAVAVVLMVRTGGAGERASDSAKFVPAQSAGINR